MSRVMTRSQPAWRATQAAPITPDAGPLKSVWTGSSPAERAVMTPPFERMERTGARQRPSPRSPASSRSK